MAGAPAQPDRSIERRRSAKLLALATRVPDVERICLKEMILRHDDTLYNATKAFEDDGDEDAFQGAVLRAVIEETVKQAQAKWDYVYERCSTEEARTTSRTDRERVLADPMDTSFTYGEIDWFSFASLLERAAPQRGDVFIDVGSGSGRALIAAALLHGHRFRQCIGIELLPGLHHLARESVARYARMIENIEASDSGTIKRRYPAVRAVQADLLSYDWSDGDVVFANSTCFSEELMEQLTEKAERLKSGARLITLTKGVESDAFELLSRQRYTMSWGGATVFLHIRK